MDAADVDIDVKLVLYSLLARLDGDSPYFTFRKQIDHMYDSCSDDSSSDDDLIEVDGDGSSSSMVDKTEAPSTSDIVKDMEDEDDSPANDVVEDISDPEADVDMVDEDGVLPKTRGELSIEDLPPIEQLTITADGVTLEKIGEIGAILDKIVVIKAYRFTPALDMESVLFLSNGAPLGRIFETFGPVVEPMYLVRFNTNDDVKQLNIAEKMAVFYAPHNGKSTKYVFVDHLRTVRGSDASWEDNNEPPPECLDYSDDEEERQAKCALAFEKRRNQYAHFLPAEKRQNQDAEISLPPSVNADATIFTNSDNLTKKECDRKVNLRTKLVGAALARARRKAARTNLADMPSAQPSSGSASNASVLSLVEEAVKSNPSLLSSIISSALSAAGNQQMQMPSGGFMSMPLALPVMLPPSADAPSQPRFLSSVPCSLPQNLQLPQNQPQQMGPSAPAADNTKRRLVDPRFMKKTN